MAQDGDGEDACGAASGIKVYTKRSTMTKLDLLCLFLPMTKAHAENRKSFPLGHFVLCEGTASRADCDPRLELEPRSSL